MDNFFPENSTINISDALIEDINFARPNTFITVVYMDCINCNRTEQTLQLVVSSRTIIYDENGNIIPVSDLRTGMTINATVSSAMTRSIPPQTSAFMIRIVRIHPSDNITVGRILDIDRQNRSFTTISDGNLSSVTRFNVPRNAIILSRSGRPVDFSMLFQGLRVRIRHASFMTASIPPQTTAFEIQIL